jgi:hypothetical protein
MSGIARLGSQGGRRAHEVRPLVLLKNKRTNIGCVDLGIHERETFIWKLRGDLFDRVRLSHADGENDIEILLGEGAKQGLERVVVACLHVFYESAQLLLGLHRAFKGGGIERLVVLAALVEDQSHANRLALGRDRRCGGTKNHGARYDGQIGQNSILSGIFT